MKDANDITMDRSEGYRMIGMEKWENLKASELPEEYRYYTLEVRAESVSQFIVDGKTKQNIEKSTSQWIMLPNKNTINRSFIIGIFFNFEYTQRKFRAASEEVKKMIASSALIKK